MRWCFEPGSAPGALLFIRGGAHVRGCRSCSWRHPGALPPRGAEAAPGAARARSTICSTTASFPSLILVNGVDGAGKGETVNLFNEWMDPRHIHTRRLRRHEATWSASTRRCGASGRRCRPRARIGILFGSWYTDPIVKRVMGHEKRAEFERRLERIRHFERMLVAEGALVLKLWFHLSKPAQKKRFKELAERATQTAWRVDARGLEALQALRRVRRRLRGRPARDQHGRGAVAGDRGLRRRSTARSPPASSCSMRSRAGSKGRRR